MIDASSYNATECRDGAFGPKVWAEDCRGGFDFTFTFEDSLLTITPAALFLLISIPRAAYLFRAPNKTKRRVTYTTKLATACMLAGIQLALLILVTTLKELNTRLSIAAAVLNLLAAGSTAILIHLEHVKSIRPSIILTAYLFASLLFDTARLRTEWLLSVNVAFAGVLSVSTVLKLAVLCLETVEKRRILIGKDGDKKPSKESTSGPLNRGLFVWLNPLLLLGWATSLTIDTLPLIYEGLSSEHLYKIFSVSWDRAMKRKKNPSLFLVTIGILKWEIASIALPRAAKIGLDISQPFLISHVVHFLSMPDSQATTNLGYGLIGGFAFVFLGSAIVTAWYDYLTHRAGAMVRGGLITLIYRKMMQLPTQELSESSAMALMGNDVETLVERFAALFVESWANAITVALSIWMLAEQMGPVCVAPIIMAVICVGLSTLVGKQVVGRQKTYQQATQQRINFTSAVLGSIKSVKMLGYTEHFTRLIEQKREYDLNQGSNYRSLSMWNNIIGNSNLPLTHVVTFGAYAIAARVSDTSSFSAAQAIAALSILTLMMGPLSFLLGNLVHAFSAFGCFQRIQEFLALDERSDTRNIQDSMPGSKGSASEAKSGDVELKKIDGRTNDGPQASIVNGEFHWSDKNVLNDINTSFGTREAGSLTMIVGPIGCGKSSLLKAILGETPSNQGLVSLQSPHIAYCDQTSWVMNTTIRNNIIAETKGFDENWYNTVIEACDLLTDMAQLPLGSDTVVGNSGLKLSGGQKQRIAIARAVYSRKPIAIFDDVMSGLDKITEQAVFSGVFGRNGLLRQNGVTVIFATHAVHRLPESDTVIALGPGGKIVEQGPFDKLRSSGSYIQSLDISNTQMSDDEDEDPPAKPEAPPAAKQSRASVGEEDVAAPPKDRTVLAYYFGAMRSFNVIIIVALSSLYSFMYTFRNVWVTWWGAGRFGHPSSDLGYWLGIFVGMAVIECLFVSGAMAQFFLVISPVSGRRLHHKILIAAMQAPMSFLSNIETGSLINRFSQDMRLVDITLPLAFTIFLFEVTACFGAAGVAVAAVSWFAISLPVVMGVLVLVQRFYVRTSKQLRLLEIEHKAPLYSHFLESMNGLVTIRAFGWIRQYGSKNFRFLDDAQKPSYLLNCIQRWLNLVLDMVVGLLTVLLVVFAVVLRDKVDPSLLGLSLVNMMALGTNMKGIIMYWSVLETSLGAIARIMDFEKNTPSEILPDESGTPDVKWPTRGDFEIDNLVVQYGAKSDPVLNKISLKIKHGEKLGLCGRSGSGKSSFIQALLRMADIVDGHIVIDGQDITRIPRSLVRQRLSCLTQEPFLFTDTIRFNADPLGEHSDDQIISALDRTGLWSIIRAKIDDDKENPLDEKMDETFLSHGQRQLFCLARALLKESSVLILDEPTSSVDSETDAKMQEVIRTEFKGRTIIMIAHRLETLLDFDKIAVLDKGCLVETGTPDDLLADDGSAFAKLYRASGKTTPRSGQ